MRPENISRFRKVKFLKELSEDDFRDKVIRPLFLRMGFEDGRDLCGPYEHGKDAVFSEKDKLGFDVLTAIQTKKGNLNLASKAQSNLVEAITQLRTATTTSITLLKNKAKVIPNKAILCASGEINEHARLHILSEVTNPNIQFLDVNDLIPLVDQNIPEIWLGIDTDIIPYLRALQTEILGSEEDAGKSGSDGILTGAADDKVFVTLKLYRQKEIIKKVRGECFKLPEFEEFPLVSVTAKKHKKVLILGDAGSGKSTGLMRIALELARTAEETVGKGSKIPILLKAVEVARSNPKDLIEYCDNWTQLVSKTSKSAFTVDDLSAGNVVLLIDALDELSEEFRVKVSELVNTFSGQYPKCQIIITSRPYRFTQELDQLKSFQSFSVSPIGWKQTEKIFTSITKNRNIPRVQSKELLRRLEKIHGIELNPLLVTVFAASTDLSKQDIPANITELFKKFTELMLGRWDERKGLKHQYQAPLKDFIIKVLAFYLHSRKETSISRVDAEQIATRELIKVGQEANVSILLTEIFDRSGLFRVIGEHIEFKHHLLQEFFAGRAIDNSDFVYSVLPEDWWKRSLVFYFGENPSSVDMLTSATEKIVVTNTRDQLEAITTIGLALQACYLSPVEEKISVWKWVVTHLGEAELAAIKEYDPNNSLPLMSFFTYFLYARDSVALSNIKQNYESILDWISNDVNLESNENKLFWLVIGLIETGDLVEAESIVKKHAPTNGLLLAAIHLSAYITCEVRPLPDKEKTKAKEICSKLNDKVLPYRQQLMKEVGSTLVEYKNGKIEIVEE